VGVNASIASGAGQVLAFAEGNVLAVGVLVALCETKIDDKDAIFVSIVAAYQEVVRLDVSMDDALLMYLLNTLNLLQRFMIRIAIVLPSESQCRERS
jgi:succinylarginine dihydrolase